MEKRNHSCTAGQSTASPITAFFVCLFACCCIYPPPTPPLSSLLLSVQVRGACRVGFLSLRLFLFVCFFLRVSTWKRRASNQLCVTVCFCFPVFAGRVASLFHPVRLPSSALTREVFFCLFGWFTPCIGAHVVCVLPELVEAMLEPSQMMGFSLLVASIDQLGVSVLACVTCRSQSLTIAWRHIYIYICSLLLYSVSGVALAVVFFFFFFQRRCRGCARERGVVHHK
jgi:hypothetical protein